MWTDQGNNKNLWYLNLCFSKVCSKPQWHSIKRIWNILLYFHLLLEIKRHKWMSLLKAWMPTQNLTLQQIKNQLLYNTKQIYFSIVWQKLWSCTEAASSCRFGKGVNKISINFVLLAYELQMITIAFYKPERYEVHLTFWDSLSQYYHWMRPIDQPSEAVKKWIPAQGKICLGICKPALTWQNWIFYSLTEL